MPKPNLALLDGLNADGTSIVKSSRQLIEDQLADGNTHIVESDVIDELEDTVLRLSDYLAAVQMVVKETFSHSVWVKAEVRNVSSKGGHYYFELAEKDETGKIIASVRGNLWRFKAERVLRRFERETGRTLERGVSVLMNVNATLHPQYGFALAINDIDPTYTLGDLARQYALMLERLDAEGLLTQNKSLPEPFDIEQVLVIAPENAAGLGDFRADADRLDHVGACHFHYETATFQGNHAPQEIRQAIIQGVTRIKADVGRLPDILVIIRGGGAVGDLAYLNDYDLAALVAEQPVPVWVGIGHERDKVLLDEVAHRSFDTPSKVIAGISRHLQALTEQAKQHMQRLINATQSYLEHAKLSSEQAMHSVQTHSQYQLERWQGRLTSQFEKVQQQAKFQIHIAQSRNQQTLDSIQSLSSQQLNEARRHSQYQLGRIQAKGQHDLEQANRHIDHLREVILLQHPARLLQQGYALVQNQSGSVLHSASQVEPNETIQVKLNDGRLTATVTEVEPIQPHQ